MFNLFKKSKSGKTPEKEFSELIIARINARLQPLDRGDLYEDPLHDMLEAAGLGEVTGGGTQMNTNGEIQFCDIEVVVSSLTEEIKEKLISELEKLGAPKGSKLIIEESETPFGKNEGMAVYLNGTDLPDEVYEQSDSNHVYEEFNRLLAGCGSIQSTWQGPTETALYMYGSSFDEMNKRLTDFIGSYPLCQKSRILQIA